MLSGLFLNSRFRLDPDCFILGYLDSVVLSEIPGIDKTTLISIILTKSCYQGFQVQAGLHYYNMLSLLSLAIRVDCLERVLTRIGIGKYHIYHSSRSKSNQCKQVLAPLITV